MRMSVPCLVLVGVLAGCAASSPSELAPPPASRADMAQVTVKREFRMLAGAQLHDLFDMGTGIEYDTALPDKSVSMPIYRLRHRVGLSLFDKPDYALSRVQKPGHAQTLVAMFKDSVRVPEMPSTTKVIRHIDERQLGLVMVESISRLGGQVLTDLPWFQRKPREIERRIRLMQLYDAEQQQLMQVLRESDKPCAETLPSVDRRSQTLGPAWSFDIAWSKVKLFFEREFRKDGYTMNDARGVFWYGESCGVVLSAEPDWNAQHLGALRGGSPVTWERPPGRMTLVGVVGYQYVHAKPIEVRAGRRYGGIYDPNNDHFELGALD